MKKNIETPNYIVNTQDGYIEIRTYRPKLVASVVTTGDRQEAIRKGFKALAGFIFGDNQTANKQAANIKMTAPVIQQSTKINMTTPVAQEKLNANEWQTSFVMPKQYTLDNLPQPNNDAIKIHQTPEEKMIVIRFSGAITNANIAQHQHLLANYIQQHDIKTKGDPIYAFYDAPWTLPMLRRNEVMWQLVG